MRTDRRKGGRTAGCKEMETQQQRLECARVCVLRSLSPWAGHDQVNVDTHTLVNLLPSVETRVRLPWKRERRREGKVSTSMVTMNVEMDP